MTCHVVLPYAWVECLNRDSCRKLIHFDAAAEVANGYPQEWVEEFLGFSVSRWVHNEIIAYRNSDGKLHRVDGPARQNLNGDVEWWVNGRRHRGDGPAVERTNGMLEWWVEGKRHREDGPAIQYADGTKQWYVNNVRQSARMTM